MRRVRCHCSVLCQFGSSKKYPTTSLNSWSSILRPITYTNHFQRQGKTFVYPSSYLSVSYPVYFVNLRAILNAFTSNPSPCVSLTSLVYMNNTVGGTLGGMAATIVSNPADVVISEMKKKKNEMSAWEALERVRDCAGWYLPAFATGLSLRMIFISLLI